jgi:ATP dependent DNA ligase domain
MLRVLAEREQSFLRLRVTPALSPLPPVPGRGGTIGEIAALHRRVGHVGGLHFPPTIGYLTDMLVVRADGFVDPCIPSRAPKPPSGPDWVHEVKHDGYRLIVRRDGDTVRLFTRRGYNWTDRYPAIAAVAAKLKARSFTLDGEAVVAGADGVAVFDALHRRGRVA